MNQDLLKRHVSEYFRYIKKNSQEYKRDMKERNDIVEYYQQWELEKLLSMNDEDVYNYLSELWAMRIWGNKRYAVDKIIEENGLNNFRRNLGELVYGKKDIVERWDYFRENIKGMGPAMISEILCKSQPNEYILWNRRAYVALNYLKVADLPRYDYQLTGKIYKKLCAVAKLIADELKKQGFDDTSLLAVDYFIWHELQVEDNLSKIPKKKVNTTKKESTDETRFIHNDIRDKIRNIGEWLGFKASIEQKVSQGSVVDTIWEATIGNMGRIIYVFEVQTKGSIDSLLLNLLKSLNNPAVQGVVAVSDRSQIEKIKAQVNDVKDLKDKLKYWDVEEISRIHEHLELVNASINELGLVPQGF